MLLPFDVVALLGKSYTAATFIQTIHDVKEPKIYSIFI